MEAIAKNKSGALIYLEPRRKEAEEMIVEEAKIADAETDMRR